jgi:hypothetical protein
MSAIEGNPDIYRRCAEGPRLAPNRLAPAFRRGPLLRVDRMILVQKLVKQEAGRRGGPAVPVAAVLAYSSEQAPDSEFGARIRERDILGFGNETFGGAFH